MTTVTNGYAEVPLREDQQLKCKVYRRRWLMLAIFVVYSMGNSCQWLHFSSISNVVVRYYNVSSYAVDWTSIIFMLTFIPLIFPGSYLATRWGLRKTFLVGAGGTALGAWIKCASVSPDRFWVAFIGQTMVACSQVFVLQFSTEVASVWFGSNQVSTACSLGVFGNQLGTALSFVLIPMAVRSHDNMEDVATDLAHLSYFMAGFTTLIFIAIITLFQNEPPLPPSMEVAKKTKNPPEFFAPLKRLLKNIGFNLLFISYGLILGVFNAFCTLLNQLILIYFEDGQEFAGRVGLLFFIGGMVGAVVCGIILDKTHRFKETTLVLYALSAASFLAFTFILETRSQVAVYISGGILGVCVAGYFAVGLQLASELTYPESESVVSGILFAGTQVTGVVFTVAYAWLIKITGDVWANIVMVLLLFIGTGITAVIKPDLKRQAAHGAVHYKPQDEQLKL